MRSSVGRKLEALIDGNQSIYQSISYTCISPHRSLTTNYADKKLYTSTHISGVARNL